MVKGRCLGLFPHGFPGWGLFSLMLLALCSCQAASVTTPAAANVTPQPLTTFPALPDIAVQSLALEYAAQELNCAQLSNALQARLAIVNRGQAGAEKFTVRLNDQHQTITGLDSEQVITITVAVKTGELIVVLDEFNQVMERDEGNNHMARSLALPPKPVECRQTPTPTLKQAAPQFTLQGHTGKVYSVAFSPDNELLASGSADNTLRLWQVSNGKLLRTMHGHPFPVVKVLFTPNGSTLITGSTDGLVRLWQVNNGLLSDTLNAPSGWVRGLELSANGALLAVSAEDYTVRILRMANMQPLKTIDEGLADIRGLAFAPDGHWVAWGEADGTVRIHGVSQGWRYAWQEAHNAAACVRFSPDGNWLAAGFASGAIRIWNLTDGSLIQLLRSHTDAITALGYLPDGSGMISSSLDGSLRRWNWDGDRFDASPSVLYSGHQDAVLGLAISSDGQWLASAGADSTIRLWSIQP